MSTADRPMEPEAVVQAAWQGTAPVVHLRERKGLIPVLAARSGNLPDPRRLSLRSVPTPVACQLTELSTSKLREWTSRRALVPADIRPKGKGSPAQFTWQTILVLRIAVLLRDQFSLELQAHKASLDKLRKALRSKSFIALWGRRLALQGSRDWVFFDEAESLPEADALVIHLDPHLRVLRDGFALPDAEASHGQMDFFSLPATQGRTAATALSSASAQPGRLRTA